nr:replication-associated protein [Reptile-associated circular DNA molecule]
MERMVISRGKSHRLVGGFASIVLPRKTSVLCIHRKELSQTYNKSRKYLLTFNNPADHGFTHGVLMTTLSTLKGIAYWCMCDERGEEGTYHTHLYVYSPNAILFSTVQQRFHGAHIDIAKGSHNENRAYVLKDGAKYNKQSDGSYDYVDSRGKRHTGINYSDTFEESGEAPPERAKSRSDSEEIMQMVTDGASNADILRGHPTAYTKLQHIEAARQTLLADKYRNAERMLNVTYIWGETGTGKTSSVMNKHGYENVFQVTNYSHPFDNYKGEPVMLFDEFRSSLPLCDMLKYLDKYPLMLPCRYSDKVACYTTVYLVSNIPLEDQYHNVQRGEKKSYEAFLRRIDTVYEMSPDTADNPFLGGAASV